MNFAKKHYEKLVLGLVLLAVAATAFWLSLKVSDVRADLDTKLQAKVGGKQKPLKPVTLDASLEALTKLTSAPAFKLDGDHNTFNPWTWMYDNNKVLIKIPDGGGGGLSYEKAIALNLTVEFAGVAGTGDPYRYQFTITRDYEKLAAKRHPTTTSLNSGDKNDLFRLVEVKGPKEAPTGLTLELNENGEKVTLVPGKPFVQTVAWAADIKSQIDQHVFSNKRVDDTFTHRNSLYKIVAISKDELVVSAPTRSRKTLKATPAP